MNTTRQSTLVRLTGLWKGTTKAGEPMLSGSINRTCRLVILKNRHKERESDPDYIALLTPIEREDGAEPEMRSEEVPF